MDNDDLDTCCIQLAFDLLGNTEVIKTVLQPRLSPSTPRHHGSLNFLAEDRVNNFEDDEDYDEEDGEKLAVLASDGKPDVITISADDYTSQAATTNPADAITDQLSLPDIPSSFGSQMSTGSESVPAVMGCPAALEEVDKDRRLLLPAKLESVNNYPLSRAGGARLPQAAQEASKNEPAKALDRSADAFNNQPNASMRDSHASLRPSKSESSKDNPNKCKIS